MEARHGKAVNDEGGPPQPHPSQGSPPNCLQLIKDPEVVPERARALSPLPTREAKDTLVDAGFYPFPALLLPPTANPAQASAEETRQTESGLLSKRSKRHRKITSS